MYWRCFKDFKYKQFPIDCVAIHSSLLPIRKEKKKSIHINTVSNSVIILREINGSVMIHNASNCLFIVSCLQIRIHTSINSLFSLCIPNHPVIEDCDYVSFSDLCLSWNDGKTLLIDKVLFSLVSQIEFI